MCFYPGSGEISVPKAWPQEGAIEFENVALRYADTLEPAVRDVSLSVRAGQKVRHAGYRGLVQQTEIPIFLIFQEFLIFTYLNCQ